MIQRICWCFGLVCVALAIGCNSASNEPVTSHETPGIEPEAPTAAVSTGPIATDDITLQPVDAAALDEVVAKHQGQVVLVDFWATWCIPCRKAFPHTVALSRKYGDKPFAAISCTLDTPDAEEDAKAFLQEQGAHFENLISSYEDDAESFEKFGLEGIPHIRLYDKSGKLAAKWDGFDEDEVESKIQELLNAAE